MKQARVISVEDWGWRFDLSISRGGPGRWMRGHIECYPAITPLTGGEIYHKMQGDWA
jgi:hypothetical protein